MLNERDKSGWVKDVLQTDQVSDNTRKVLDERLNRQPTTKASFFATGAFQTLQALCSRLIPQPQDRPHPVDLPGLLDQYLIEGKGNGWRYDLMPADEEAFRQGIAGFDETAVLIFSKHFIELDKNSQHDVIRSVQFGEAAGNIWQKVPSQLFFEELLGVLVELYYSHPTAKEEIGDASFADANGWNNIGLENAPI
ncbi:gluconate 2-dehydrogenase subunit 3 family protein [Dyadobacter arcticus]|uniref:Gluconate 2-dehydrogenase subunit 3 family protein n=1 Tax=Dyadobacter arcticus TaxID=1078754 RepID=A0ABX0USE4_9BACT|nr:gluconate 2-dehydrogenase subunit 3 family protein [Dyadobacter arcticus]NIJ54575.1 hypothetical protein [Dyadobacter arcticus]